LKKRKPLRNHLPLNSGQDGQKFGIFTYSIGQIPDNFHGKKEKPKNRPFQEMAK